jgi:hypothetical protein
MSATKFEEFTGNAIRRYWVEACCDYYPSGGFDDIKGQFTTLEDAEAFAMSIKGYDYVKVVDVMELLILPA